MSKYDQRGDYHYEDFAIENSMYRNHVLALMHELTAVIGKQGEPFWLHEVGCGEGLILEKISEYLGWMVTGNDADKTAVALAMARGRIIRHNNNALKMANIFDAVLFADSLEHIENWKEHVEWAQKSRWVIVAVPDRHDPHGLRDFKEGEIEALFNDERWTLVEKRTRYARRVMIFKRHA